MKNKIFTVCFILFIIAGLCMFNNLNKKDLTAQDYFPKEPMVKEFSGGFENEGFSRNYDLFKENKVQVKQEDCAVDVVFIYELSDEEVVQVYNKEIVGHFEEDYISNFQPNANNVIIKTPIKKGTKWSTDNGGEYAITDVNVKIETPLGKYNTIEITYTLGDFKSVSYYAKDIGLVKRVYGDNYVDELIGISQ